MNLKPLILLALLACTQLSQAAVIRYDGRDALAGPTDTRPNSQAAHDAFVTAIGSNYFTLTFEGLPLGYAQTLNFTTFKFEQVGTTNLVNEFLGSDDTGQYTGVTKNTPTGEEEILGFNTSTGGDTFLRFTPKMNIGTAGATLTFNTPIEYFGAYISGLGSAAGTLNAKFNDGSAQSLGVAGGPGGGVQFFGFTSFGSAITQLDLVLDGVYGSRDIYSIDDVITSLKPDYIETGKVPEPASASLLLAALGLLAMRRR
jgi:hypothetical protein